MEREKRKGKIVIRGIEGGKSRVKGGKRDRRKG